MANTPLQSESVSANQQLTLLDASNAIHAIASDIEDAAALCNALSQSEVFARTGEQPQLALNAVVTLLEGLAAKGEAESERFGDAATTQRVGNVEPFPGRE